MKKHIIQLILVVSTFFIAVGCDDYLDVNTPSGVQDESDLEAKDIMAPIMRNTVTANYYAAITFGNYVQYFGSYGFGASGFTTNATTWNVIYTDILPNIKSLKAKTAVTGALHYEAVAKILEAINMSFAVECWGDVTYSQATEPTLYQYPMLDDGETVYNQTFDLLNEAIATLEAPDPSGIFLGSEDIIYGGGTEGYAKWLRAAYTYKARMQLKMMKNGGTTASDVLASINKGFTSNDDDFQLDYPDDKTNPYYSTNIVQRSTSNIFNAVNDQLISLMNGSQYPFNGTITEDPRLTAMFVKETAVGVASPSTDPWRGFLNGGTGLSSDGQPANVYYKDGGFHTSSTSPLILITYAEAMFIKAEAEFLANGGTTTSTGTTASGYSAYLAGIQANMTKLDVSGVAYLADTAVNVGQSNLQLNQIMKEKYIANIHNTETFSDFRRYNFSSNVFKGLALRIQQPEDEYLGQWFVRAVYPTSETNSNTNIPYDETSCVTNIWLFE
ncbi:SusD-like starch-binding protein associating with outer membrane [Mariniflexile fucanivorans]|uniref:SusD-like starch-binding protein associating with outer membrane n=1 Tax=Mariniflexile fucanivorans TaxID=264023 RepID=A0A4R1RC90_9FLAO|nr:SusD/RagB family nutrient-binding outer membrane lipoprotein [Mariniflexile fucanivorans]TCL63454.1 SusD-like starch-binding protein associating with outer membrane [Mariniflexile fucanivorans]